MRIWHISDTHSMHRWLEIPQGVDMVIHSGDCSNPRDLELNEIEVRDFLDWYCELPIRYKIFVGGNHDVSIESRRVKSKDIESKGIVYLENSFIEIEGINIWGTPVTPVYGEGWAWMRDRSKMDKLWRSVPLDTDILVSHGPPKGILDLTYDRKNQLDLCGCSAMKKVVVKLNPKLCLFGHIHNFKDLTNAGIKRIYGCDTLFSNGSCAYDGKFMNREYFNNGNIIDI